MSRALFWADVFQQDSKLREIDSLKYHYCIFIPFMLLVRMTCFIGHDSRQVCVEDVMSRYGSNHRTAYSRQCNQPRV